VHLLIVAVGLCLWGYSAANNALNYTKTVAEVERVEDVCVQVGKPLETATNCLEVQADSGGKRMRRYRAVLVRYTSPRRWPGASGLGNTYRRTEGRGSKPSAARDPLEDSRS